MDFIAVDNPTATKFTIHILAAVAEHERDAISWRTTEALVAAKARGVKLGNYARISKAKQEATAARGGHAAGHRLDIAHVRHSRCRRPQPSRHHDGQREALVGCASHPHSLSPPPLHHHRQIASTTGGFGI